MTAEERCKECGNTNGEHVRHCSRFGITPREWAEPMKTEEITKRLRDKARSGCPPKFPYERMIEWIAADAIDAQAAEIASMGQAFETVFPARDGFTEAFDDLVALGLLVEVPSDAAYREWWGDEPTMWVWRWHPLATPSTTEET